MFFSTSNLQPIYSSVFSVDFGYENLNYFCFKITDEYFHFNVNEFEKKAIPLQLINNIISSGKKLDVVITLFNKNGDEISIVYLVDVIMLKLENLLNFDFSSNNIIKIKVKHDFLKMKIFNNNEELKIYQRKRKLEKINQIKSLYL